MLRRKHSRVLPESRQARGCRCRLSAAAAPFPKVSLFTIDEVFGGWAKAHARHFADGGEFDRMITKKR